MVAFSDTMLQLRRQSPKTLEATLRRDVAILERNYRRRLYLHRKRCQRYLPLPCFTDKSDR